MNFFRKNLFGLAVVSVLALGSVLAVEAFHHHEALESRTDCSFCSWQQTGSQSPSLPSAPALVVSILVFSFYFTFQLSSLFTFPLPSLGRAPPQNLL